MMAPPVMVGWEVLLGRFSLTRPYELSFTSVTTVDSIVVRCTDADGAVGVGEVVPLEGYTGDTTAAVVADLKNALPALVGCDAVECRVLVTELLGHRPMARSLACQALETCRSQPVLAKAFSREVVGAFSSDVDGDKVVSAIAKLCEAGYTTLKWKVGRQPELDIALVPQVLAVISDDLQLRIDANQAFAFDDARRFIDAFDQVNVGCVELLEQPFGTDEAGWLNHEALLREGSRIPLMLDESILTVQDIERAARIGAAWVKLKLLKHDGIAGVVSLARQAQAMGVNVVLGNGVSTEIGNLYEAMAAIEAGEAVQGALESNGFARLAVRPTNFPVRIEQGCMVWNERSCGNLASYLAHDRYALFASFGL